MDAPFLAISDEKCAPAHPPNGRAGGSPAAPPTVGRGRGGAWGGESVLAVFGWRGIVPAPPPIDPSRLTRFRPRLGASGAEWVGKATMEAGLDSGTVKPRAWRRVTVETTVPDQAVTCPTDRQRLNRSRVRLVRRCRPDEVGGRQRDARQGPPARRRANRSAPARRFRRLNRRIRCLRTYLGRVVQDYGKKNRGQIGPPASVCGRAGEGSAVAGAGEEGPEPAVPLACIGSGGASVRAKPTSGRSSAYRGAWSRPTGATSLWVEWRGRGIPMTGDRGSPRGTRSGTGRDGRSMRGSSTAGMARARPPYPYPGRCEAS